MNTQKKIVIEIDDDGESDECVSYLSTSAYEQMRSALTDLYYRADISMDSEFDRMLLQYIKGLKRVIAAEKKKTGKKMSEGV